MKYSRLIYLFLSFLMISCGSAKPKYQKFLVKSDLGHLIEVNIEVSGNKVSIFNDDDIYCSASFFMTNVGDKDLKSSEVYEKTPTKWGESTKSGSPKIRFEVKTNNGRIIDHIENISGIRKGRSTEVNRFDVNLSKVGKDHCIGIIPTKIIFGSQLD